MYASALVLAGKHNDMFGLPFKFWFWAAIIFVLYRTFSGGGTLATRCRFCGKGLKKIPGSVSRQMVCHHCGRHQADEEGGAS